MEKRERRGRVRREGQVYPSRLSKIAAGGAGSRTDGAGEGKGRGGEKERLPQKKRVRRKETIFPKRRGGRRARKLDERIPTNNTAKRLEFTEFILSVLFLQRERDAEGLCRNRLSRRGEI